MADTNDTVTYYAQSTLLSKTFWFNAAVTIVAVLQLTDVIAIIPPTYYGAITAFIAVVNVILRQYSVRPVALVMPGTVKAIEVSKLPMEGVK